MANVKITQLPSATTPLTGTEVFPLVQGTTTKQVAITGLFTDPVMTNPTLGTVGQADLINATGLPIASGVSGLGAGIATFLGTPSSANLRTAVTDETGTGALVFANAPVLVAPDLGTPSVLVATNATGTAVGLTAGSAITNANLTGAVTSVGNATSLGSFTSAQLRTALTDETGAGSAVFATSPTITAPILNQINDTNNAQILGLSPTTSAVDYLVVKNGIGVGVPLHFYADGSSANIGLHIQPKGTGLVTISDGTDFNKGIRFRSSSSAASAITLLDAVSTAGRVVTLPDATTTLVGRDTTDTLTNKTIAFSSNTFSGTLAIANGGTNASTAALAIENLLPAYAGNGSKGLRLNSGATALEWVADGGGTVTSVAASVPSFLSIAGSPITTSGTLAFTLSGTALPTTSGGTGLTSFTSGGVVYASSTSALATTSALTFDGASTLTMGTNNVVRNSAGYGVFRTDTDLYLDAKQGGVSGDILFRLAATEQMRLNSTGLGIGTSSPSEKLDVRSSSNAIGNFQSSNASGYAGINAINGSRNWYAGIRADASNGFGIRDETASATRLLIDSAGNLGLGVTPSAWSGITALQVKNASMYGSGNEGGIYANAYYNGGWKYIATAAATGYDSNATAGQHRWYNAPSGTAGNAISFTQAMTLNASGNLGIGTTSPSERLDVVSSSDIKARIYTPNATTSGNSGLTLQTGSYNWLIQNLTTVAGSGGVLRFYDLTAGGERARFDTSGTFIVGGTATVDGPKVQIFGAKSVTGGIPAQQLNVADTSAIAAGAGGAISFGALYSGSSYTTMGSVEGVKENATSGDYAGALVFRSRANGGNNNENMRLNSAGNLGLGVTPSAWNTGKALEVGFLGTSVWGEAAGEAWLLSNAYYNAGFKYATASSTASGGYNISKNSHKWSIASAGTAGNAISFTQAMTLDASGRLLVGGTTASNTILRADRSNSSVGDATVNSVGHFVNTYDNNTNGSTAYPVLSIERLGASGISNNSLFEIGLSRYSTASTDAYTQANFIVRDGNSSSRTTVATLSNNLISFSTNNTERARIDSSGNLLVGTTSVSTYTGNSLAYEPTGSYLVQNHASAKASGAAYTYFQHNGSEIGSITQSGTTAVLYNTTSDQRLKENIQDADSASSLIDSLQVRKFDWKTDQTHQRYGFVAQELVTVAPEAVHQPTDTEEMMAVDYSKLVPMLVKEIQSLRQRLSAANL